MNLGDMKDWVVRTVKRPEKRDDQIQDAINAAIEYAITRGDFVNDLAEVDVAISSSVYSQSIVISTSFTRFRKIKYLRPSTYKRYLNWRDPSRIFNQDGCEATDVWYRAGDNLVFNLSVLQSVMKVGYYQYPAFLTQDSDTQWTMDQMPSCIHDLACWRTFEQIGNESESSRFFNIASKYLAAHKDDKQDGVTHS